jgi:hypothetical protein
MEDGQIPVVPIVLAIFAIIFVVALIGMMIFVVFLFSMAAKRRRRDTVRGGQMQHAASQVGFNFKPQAPLSELPYLSSFELFEGYPYELENLMRGKINGSDALIFDLAYRNVGGAYGGGTTTSRETMFTVTSPNLNLPEFYLRPEGVLERVLDTMSRVDIDIAERPDFSQKFLLYGKDESAIRQIFRGTKLDFFANNPNICVFGRGNYLFLYQSRTLAPPAQLGQYLQYFGQICDLFSAHR